MLYLHTNDECSITTHEKPSTFTLPMNQINMLPDNHSFIPTSRQTDILLFMALRERIPLILHTLDSSEIHSINVYIEGIDYLQKKLIIRRMDSSISNKYDYVYEEESYLDSLVTPLILV